MVYHNDSEAETASAVYMTIEKTGDDRITVTVESADTDPVDRVVIGAQAGDPTGYGGLTAMELTDGVASIDLFWGAAQMPDTHSFIVEWSKVSAPGDGGAGNWALTQEQLGTIDTSFVASTDNSGGDGDDDAVPQTAAPGASSIDADDIVLYTETGGTILTDDAFPQWDWQTGTLAPLETGGDVGNVLKFSDLNFQGINLRSTDLSVKSSLTLDLWSEVAGKLKIYLANDAGAEEGYAEYGVIVEVDADQAGDWTTFNIPLTDFVGVDLTSVNQMRFDNQNNDGGVGDDTGLVTFYVDNMAFTGDPVSYDTVTLDYESGDTYGAVSFDGAADPVIETVSDAYGGAADTAALRVEKLTGDHVADWAGVKVIVAPTGANLVADPSAPIEMQVYSTVDGGSITVKLEGSGAPYQFPDSSGLSLGWNSVTVTPPAGLDAMNTLVIMPDLFGPQGNVYYVDEVSLMGVLMAEPDPVPQTAAPSASGLGADDVGALYRVQRRRLARY